MQLGFWQTLRRRAIGAHLYGMLIVGVGSRLAMLALRLTSPQSVRGVESDDGFTIGRFTLFGTYNLLMLGAVAGLLGLIVFSFVEPFLIGPRWLERLTLATGGGIVVGSMLVHADGVDFNLLQPEWFAVALFVALPALVSAFFGDALRFASSNDRWINQPGARQWLVPFAVVAAALPTIVILPFVTALTFVARTSHTVAAELRASTRARALWAGRVLWLAVVALGGRALLADAAAIL